MSSASHGAGCGVVLGIVIVIFLQQVAFIDLSGLVSGLVDLILGAVVGGVIGAAIGYALGRAYLNRQQVTAADAGKS